MKFTRTCIALAGAGIVLVANAMRPQSATAATAEPTAHASQLQIDSANRLFEAGKFAEAGKASLKGVDVSGNKRRMIVELGRLR